MNELNNATTTMGRVSAEEMSSELAEVYAHINEEWNQAQPDDDFWKHVES